MANLASAQAAVYQLWNLAEHVTRMAQGAQGSLDSGDMQSALADLQTARGSAGGVESRLQWAVEEIANAIKEGE